MGHQHRYDATHGNYAARSYERSTHATTPQNALAQRSTNELQYERFATQPFCYLKNCMTHSSLRMRRSMTCQELLPTKAHKYLSGDFVPCGKSSSIPIHSWRSVGRCRAFKSLMARWTITPGCQRRLCDFPIVAQLDQIICLSIPCRANGDTMNQNRV